LQALLKTGLPRCSNSTDEALLDAVMNEVIGQKDPELQSELAQALRSPVLCGLASLIWKWFEYATSGSGLFDTTLFIWDQLVIVGWDKMPVLMSAMLMAIREPLLPCKDAAAVRLALATYLPSVSVHALLGALHRVGLVDELRASVNASSMADLQALGIQSMSKPPSLRQDDTIAPSSQPPRWRSLRSVVRVVGLWRTYFQRLGVRVRRRTGISVLGITSGGEPLQLHVPPARSTTSVLELVIATFVSVRNRPALPDVIAALRDQLLCRSVARRILLAIPDLTNDYEDGIVIVATDPSVIALPRSKLDRAAFSLCSIYIRSREYSV
jgi:hypothetical protein